MSSPNDDAHGSRTRITHPDGNYFVYAYDDADRFFRLTQNGTSTTLASIFFDEQRWRVTLTRGAYGAPTGYEFDAISRLEVLTHDLDGTEPRRVFRRLLTLGGWRRRHNIEAMHDRDWVASSAAGR